MDQIEPRNESIQLSIEQIIDLIRTVRNDLVKNFLKNDFLHTYYSEHFDRELSTVKREFLKRDLKELLIAPVSLVHYAGLINQIRDTGNVSLLEKNSQYFYREIDQILMRYGV